MHVKQYNAISVTMQERIGLWSMSMDFDSWSRLHL